jgi:dolichyl-phosphooligosaccharide-protein glycotransferase
MVLLIQDRNNPQSYAPARLNKQEYYMTTISRLHNFDGSMGTPSVAYYVEYADPSATTATYPVVVTAQRANVTDAKIRAEQYNLKAAPGYHAEVMNPESTTDIVHPIDTVPALQHYRLVHESPTNVFDATSGADIRYVKIFEYVKGAHIKGEGIIEVPVITNTGRSYVYWQESVNGEFIVPYSTTGNTYDVKTTGKYTIKGTGKQYEVPESAISEGITIQ